VQGYFFPEAICSKYASCWFALAVRPQMGRRGSEQRVRKGAVHGVDGPLQFLWQSSCVSQAKAKAAEQKQRNFASEVQDI